MPVSIVLSMTELCDNEQWYGRELGEVLDGGEAVECESSIGTLRVQSERDLFR